MMTGAMLEITYWSTHVPELAEVVLIHDLARANETVVTDRQ